MNIAIVGAGGVGGYIGAKLIHARQADVTVVARGEHLEAIKADGLTVKDEEHEFKVSAQHFTKNPAKNAPYDVVIFCTKSFDLEEAAWHMGPCVDENTLLFSLSNGLGHEQVLKRVFPKNPIATACIYILSNITAPGVIKKYGGVFLLIAGSTPQHPKLTALATLFNDADMRFKLSKDIQLECWRKYLFISTFGSLTAFYDEPVGKIIQERATETKNLLNEIVAVANAKGIALNQKNITQAMEQARTKVPYEATTSMQLDIRAHRQSEVEALSGHIVREAKRVDVNVPTLSQLYEGLRKKVTQK